jgi:hypothetical protein
MRYARREQLSVNIAFQAAGLTPTVLPFDVMQSDFHSWPHVTGRDRARGGRDPAISQMPLGARVRELEQRLAERDAAIATLQAAQQEAAAFKTDAERLAIEIDTVRAEAQRRHDEAAAAREAETAAQREEIEQAVAAALRNEADAARLAVGLADLSSRHEAVLASTSWRVTAPLRAIARRSPPALRATLRRSFRLLWRAATWPLGTRRRPSQPLPSPTAADETGLTSRSRHPAGGNTHAGRRLHG